MGAKMHASVLAPRTSLRAETTSRSFFESRFSSAKGKARDSTGPMKESCSASTSEKRLFTSKRRPRSVSTDSW